MLKHIYLLLIILGLFFSRQTYLYSQDSTVDFYNPSNEVLSFFEKKAEKLISEMTIEEKASQMVLLCCQENWMLSKYKIENCVQNHCDTD